MKNLDIGTTFDWKGKKFRLIPKVVAKTRYICGQWLFFWFEYEKRN